MANLSIRRGEPRESLAGVLDPFRMMDPHRTLDPFRMIRELFGTDPFAGMVPATGGLFAPDVEIKETKDSYIIRADLPGVPEQGVEVSVMGNRLTLSGRREEEDRREEDRFFAYERSYGAFSRSFVLPESADVSKVKGDLKDGVLEITIPKKAEMQPRRVEIGGQGTGARAMGAGRRTSEGAAGESAGMAASESAGKAASETSPKAAGEPPEKKAA